MMHEDPGTLVDVLVKQYSFIDLKHEFHNNSQYNRKRIEDYQLFSSAKI